MNLNCGGARSTETGYGRMTAELIDAIEAEGVTVDDYAPNERNEDGTPKWGTSEHPVHRNGLWMTAPNHVRGWWKGQRVHMFTMWEATGSPGGFRENIHEFDTIICPSEQNRELFSRFHDNVVKVPLGINPTIWHYRERPPVDAEFRFLVCGSGARKGIDVATRAFKEVFGGFTPSANDPMPTLTVKNRRSLDEVNGERIRQISGTIPQEDEVELYANAHCFLGLARGEGWGMMPFQAMAQGCPTILTDAHGHAEFSHLAAVPISTTMVHSDKFMYSEAGDWWEPDFQEVCESMWDMYVNYEDYLPVGKHAAEVIADEYTWGHSARKIIEIIGPDSLRHPDLVDPSWYEPTIQVFQIITNRDKSYEINGVVYNFKKGEVYYESADLKRMMFDNDVLDPVCIQDVNEPGLLPDQLTEVERYKARNSRCYACGQKYNSDMTLDFDDEDVGDLIL